MPENSIKPAPGLISPEAKKWLANVVAGGEFSMELAAVQQRRAMLLEQAQPTTQQAIDEHQVTITHTEINSVRCMVISPSERNTNRTMMYLFGGAFCHGGPFEDLPISASIAAKTGARVIAPYYRLTPEHPYPAALDDIYRVARQMFTLENPACLMGESAGANLSLALMHRLRGENLPGPPAVALLSPPVDFAQRGDSFAVGRDPSLDRVVSPLVEASYVGENDITNPEISPIYGEFDADFPACLITTGTRDLFLSSATRLARILREAGSVVDLRVWEGMWHVFEYYAEIPEAEASLKEISEFFEEYF